jgi:hypothetical protein
VCERERESRETETERQRKRERNVERLKREVMKLLFLAKKAANLE